MKVYRILLFLLFFQLNLDTDIYGQQKEFIIGKIIAGGSAKPIPFATIKLKHRAIGVISNAEGDFQLPSAYRLLKDTLEVSCIGYDTKAVILTSLRDSVMNVIKLIESTQQLSAVEISARRKGRVTGYKIVAAALQNIINNNPQHPFCYEAYYRDYQIIDNDYINLNEALVEVLDSGFQTNDQVNTKIKLYEYKKNFDFPRDTTTEVAYDNQGNKFIPNAKLKSFGGNELTILRVHDAIRNNKRLSFSFIYKLQEDFLANHIFSISDHTYLDKVPLYCIKFVSKQSVTGTQHFARGRIYVEHGNFAIHKIEYVTYEKQTMDNKVLYDIQLEYARNDGAMYLNYISFNNFFKLKDPRDFTVVDMGIDPGANVFIIEVNNFPDPVSALNAKNYDLQVDGMKIEIEEIKIDEANKKEIILFLKENRHFDRWEHPSKMLPKLKIYFTGIKDLNGRELDRPTYIPINQFRELFVQKVNAQGAFKKNDSYIERDRPLSQNVTRIGDGNSSYWMNTPLKKK